MSGDRGVDFGLTAPSAPVGDGWAVIVGISNYLDASISLRFARRDAEEFHDQLIAGTGGLFTADRVRLLLDEQATQRELTRALRGFLPRAQPDDVVVLYVACHGGPDPRQPLGALYFLTHDTEPADVAGTGVPMDEIDRLLRQLPDRRVVIIADTCHSAGLVGMPGGRDNTPVAAVTNDYLKALGQAGAGVALLTSAEASEVSREDEKWGGGHGVFTHFLLDGMRGAADGADGPRDGVVTVGELFEYVRQRVASETGGSQHPSLHTAQAARLLPLAITGSADLDNRAALAELSLQVGWLTGERGPFVAAAALAEDASMLARLGGRAFSDLDALRAQALLAAGDFGAARSALDAVINNYDDGPPPGPVLLARGITLAELGDADAADALEEFAKSAPDDVDTPWAKAWSDWMHHPGGRHMRALLIGIADYGQRGMSLLGPINDLEDVRATLRDLLGVPESNIRTLMDSEATVDAARSGLAELAELSRDGALVFVYFSGHAMLHGGLDDACLLFTNFDDPGAAFTPREFAATLDELPESTLVILDTHITEALESTLAARPATSLVACGPGEMAFERQIDGVVRGAFTHGLTTAWRDLGPSASTDELLKAVLTKVDNTSETRPRRLGGDSGEPTQTPRFAWAELWRQRRCRPLDLDTTIVGVDRLEASGYPSALWLAARLRASLGDGKHAAECMASIVEPSLAATLDRLTVLIAAGDFDAARAMVAGPNVPVVGTPDQVQQILVAIEASAAAEISALVVGIERYESDQITGAPGASDDAQSLATALVSAGLNSERVSLLRDEEAVRARLDQEIEQLAKRAQHGAGILCLAGVGSKSDDWATFLPFDARRRDVGDLSLRELAARLQGNSGIVTILDCGFESGARAQPPAGVGAPREIGLPKPAGTAQVRSSVRVPQIGAITIQPPTPGEGFLATLAQTLPGAVEQGNTYRQWAEAVGPVSVVGAVETVALTPTVTDARLRQVLRDVELGPARAAIEVGRRLIGAKQQQGGLPVVERLAVGLAFVAIGDRVSALSYLRQARTDADAAKDADRAVPVHVEAMLNSHLGRLLAEGSDPTDLEHAVAFLRDALESDAGNPTIGLHLALAMQAQLERRTMRDVADLYRAYLKAGAPDGRARDIRARLGTIAQT